MNTRTRILVLFDNNGAEYVSRISEGATRFGRNSGFLVQADNLYPSGKPIAGCIDSDSLAGVVLTPPLSDDRHVLSMLEERKLPYVRIAPLLDSDRGTTVVHEERL